MGLNIVDINVSYSKFTNVLFIFVTFLRFLTFFKNIFLNVFDICGLSDRRGVNEVHDGSRASSR